MPSIKYWYFEICAWHSPHVGKLGTNVVVPLFQILYRTLLRIKTHDKHREVDGGMAGGLEAHIKAHQLTLNCWWSYRS